MYNAETTKKAKEKAYSKPRAEGGIDPIERANALRVLGFDPTSSPSETEIRRAYKQGAMKEHPDREHNRDDPKGAAKRFNALKEAHDLLISNF